MELPGSARYVVMGAGIHGLSTAWHLATELERRGQGDGDDVVTIDKTGIGAGPSGIACGVIRSNYFQPAMRELMAHSVQVWESDPEAFLPPDRLPPDRARGDAVRRRHDLRAAEGDRLHVGADRGRGRLSLLHGVDLLGLAAKNITAVLHEKKGGYAENMPSMRGLRAKSEDLGVALHAPVSVTEFRVDGGAVTAVETDRGADRLRAGRGRGRSLGPRLLAHARPARRGGREGARRERLRTPDVDLLVPAGNPRRRPELPPRQRGQHAAGGARGHRRC